MQRSRDLGLALDPWRGMPDECRRSPLAGCRIPPEGLRVVGLPVRCASGVISVRAGTAGLCRGVQISCAGSAAHTRIPLVLNATPWHGSDDLGLTGRVEEADSESG